MRDSCLDLFLSAAGLARWWPQEACASSASTFQCHLATSDSCHVSLVAWNEEALEAQASWGHQRAWPAAEGNKSQEPQILEPQQDMHCTRCRIASYCVKPWDGQKGIHPCLVGIIVVH